LLTYQKERYSKLLTVFQKWRETLKCCRCGEADAACLEFHHSDPSQKELGVIKMITRSMGAVLKELKKCVVVCANCHRRIHAYNIDTDPTLDDLAAKFETFVNEN
jgi:transcription elongation factor Elf1